MTQTQIVWSERAIDNQRQLNEEVRARLGIGSTGALEHQILPRLVRTKEAILSGSSGECELLSGQLGSTLEGTGDVLEMFNIASDCDLEEGVDCLAFRIGIPEAGNGGWVLQRCQGQLTDDQINNPVQCLECTTGFGPTFYRVDFTTVNAGTVPLGRHPDDADAIARFLLNKNFILEFQEESIFFGYCEWASKPEIVPSNDEPPVPGLDPPPYTIELFWRLRQGDQSFFELKISTINIIQTYRDTGILDATARDCFNASRAITLDQVEFTDSRIITTPNPVLNLEYNG